MAYPYRAWEGGAVLAANKDLLNVFNASPAAVVSAYAFYLLNNQQINNHGALVTIQVRRINGVFGQNGFTMAAFAGVAPYWIQRLNPLGPQCPQGVTKGTGRIVTGVTADVFRHITWSGATALMSSSMLIDNWQTQVPNQRVWDAGMLDTTVEPMTCRPGFGAELFNGSSSTTANVDCAIDFTA